MTSHSRLLLFAVLIAGLLAGGCYDRFTGNYDEIPELMPSRSALIESSDSSMAEKRRIELLEKLEKENVAIYRIDAGDKIAISVYNNPDLDIKTTVTPDGLIGMMFLGQVKVSGLTLEEATELIEEKLSQYIRNPKVGISPYEIQSETVTITGAIMRPGMYTVTHGMRLADLMAQAGGGATRFFDGQTLDATDFDKSVFVRDDQTVPIDFARAISTGQKPDNILLRKGDYIYIAPREENMVYVVGDISKPYRLIWSKNLGLLELLSSAGWVNETHWSHVIILRGGIARPKMYKVDLDGIMAGKRSNVYLEPGDIVYVPKDNISEYNVFVRKLLPTAQLLNMLTTPMTWYSSVGI